MARRAAGSESTRLLCAGVYLDDSFRDRVIDELYVHEERCAAPSLGVDVARVLAHALRARRLEGAWSLLIMALWALLFFFVPGLGVLLLVACLLLVAGAWAQGKPAGLFTTDYPDGPLPTSRLRAARTLRWTARFLLLSYAVSAVSAISGKDRSPGSGGFLGLFTLVTGHIGKGSGWMALAVPAVMTAAIHLYGVGVARVLATELSPDRFAGEGDDSVLGSAGAAFRRIAGQLRREQHSQLIIYHERHPFLGAGTPREPWTLATELKREDGARPGELDIQKLITKLTQSVEKLKSPIVSVPPEAKVYDRLSGLQVQECVFLQSTGLASRGAAPRSRAAVEEERVDSMRLGGEVRRHFLRIHVGAWEEELVVTVFVRVHTQGGMLMVEFAPHILYPIRAEFRSADRVSHASRAAGLPVAVLSAAVRTPAAAGRALLWAVREALFRWRVLTSGARNVLPDGPWCSIRELGSASSASLFQEMDVSRYLKSVQDRVASGVRAALKDSGWQTDDFDKKIVNVGSGGVYIESTHHSTIGIGDHNTLTNTAFEKAGGPLVTD
ncbi:MAG: hypothetical protein HOY79_11435 [Streptomyces sp.]|nr:hypothetical protein [Streptomyces sp.]